jgi:hypothetical protein
MDNKEQCRAEFEAWAATRFLRLEKSSIDDRYCYAETLSSWGAWQAARATSPAPAVVQMTADARDAALLRALIADYRLGYRWRMKNGRQQWQVVDDGDPWGKWGEFREVMNTFLGVKHG